MDGDGRGVLGIECSWEDVVMDGDGWELWGVAARSSEDTDIDRNGWGVLGVERSREDAAVDEMEREDVAMEGDAWEVWCQEDAAVDGIRGLVASSGSRAFIEGCGHGRSGTGTRERSWCRGCGHGWRCGELWVPSICGRTKWS